jgi:hypothetical protein
MHALLIVPALASSGGFVEVTTDAYANLFASIIDTIQNFFSNLLGERNEPQPAPIITPTLEPAQSEARHLNGARAKSTRRSHAETMRPCGP